jgi:hypothetical protein
LSRIEEISARLEQITAELSDPGIDDERAGELSKEAAGLAAEASEEVNRALREASSDE